MPGAEAGEETVYLVCTSAGEVGVNISADHLVCDLSTFESMAQRFGRVNRFGDRDDTRIDIVHLRTFDENDEYDSRRAKGRWTCSNKLNGDGSPDALANLDRTERLAAFSPTPTILPTSDILFDAWALTTIRDSLPGRPPVEPYLHGVSPTRPPETRVAWREEVEIITGALTEQYTPEDLLEDYPLKPHELLRDRSDRVFKRLVLACGRDNRTSRVVARRRWDRRGPHARGSSPTRIGRTGSTTDGAPSSHGGGLQGGLLTGDPTRRGRRRRRHVAGQRGPSPSGPHALASGIRRRPGGMRLIRIIDTRPDAEEGEEGDSEADVAQGGSGAGTSDLDPPMTTSRRQAAGRCSGTFTPTT